MPVHALPAKSVLSQSSLKPALFGFCAWLSQKNLGSGLEQELASSKHPEEHFSVPVEKPKVWQVLPPRSEPSQSSLSWFLDSSPHFGLSGFAMQLPKLKAQSFLQANVPPL